MFNLKHIIKKKNNPMQSDNHNYDIDLNTILFVLKYGNEIGLNVEDSDIYEDGGLLALRRSLKVDGIRIDVSQWADWTISITLSHQGQKLKVAESLVPDELIDWNSSNNFINRNLDIEWVTKGSWCMAIYNTINSLKQGIDNKRAEEQLEIDKKKAMEKAKEDEDNKKKAHYFENIYKRHAQPDERSC